MVFSLIPGPISGPGGGGGGSTPTPGGDATVYPETPKFILSLESGVSYQRLANITTTNIYFVPKNGNTVTIYNGSSWDKLSSSEITLSLLGLTANKNYDVFAYNNSGTLALETLVWSSDTARATAVTQFQGLYIKSGDNTRLYVGSFRTTATGTTERKAIVSTAGTENAKLLLYNAYNQQDITASIKITASTWSTSSATWRVINNSANYRSLFLVGLPTKISGQYTTFAVSTGITTSSSVTFGIDAATPHAQAVAGSTQVDASGVTIIGAIETEVSAGFHSLNALEAQFTGGAGSFYASGFGSGLYESLIRLKLKS